MFKVGVAVNKNENIFNLISLALKFVSHSYQMLASFFTYSASTRSVVYSDVSLFR